MAGRIAGAGNLDKQSYTHVSPRINWPAEQAARSYLRDQATFAPFFAQHYAISRPEIRELAQTLNSRPTFTLGVEAHAAVFMSIDRVLHAAKFGFDPFGGTSAMEVRMRKLLESFASSSDYAAGLLWLGDPTVTALKSVIELELGRCPDHSLERQAWLARARAFIASDLLPELRGGKKGHPTDFIRRDLAGTCVDLSRRFSSRYDRNAATAACRQLLAMMADRGIRVATERGALPPEDRLHMPTNSVRRAQSEFRGYINLSDRSIRETVEGAEIEDI